MRDTYCRLQTDTRVEEVGRSPQIKKCRRRGLTDKTGNDCDLYETAEPMYMRHPAQALFGPYILTIYVFGSGKHSSDC